MSFCWVWSAYFSLYLLFEQICWVGSILTECFVFAARWPAVLWIAQLLLKGATILRRREFSCAAQSDVLIQHILVVTSREHLWVRYTDLFTAMFNYWLIHLAKIYIHRSMALRVSWWKMDEHIFSHRCHSVAIYRWAYGTTVTRDVDVALVVSIVVNSA